MATWKVTHEDPEGSSNFVAYPSAENQETVVKAWYENDGWMHSDSTEYWMNQRVNDLGGCWGLTWISGDFYTATP